VQLHLSKTRGLLLDADDPARKSGGFLRRIFKRAFIRRNGARGQS
jgi:hypothetical protein